MREIKFRAIPKEKCLEDMNDILNSIEFYSEGMEYDGTFIYGHYNGGYILGETIEAEEDYYSPSYWIPVKKETIGQYTGLKDCNGKEIYEGDIVHVKSIIYTDCSKEEVGVIHEQRGIMEFHQNCWCVVRPTQTGKSIKPLFFCNIKDKEDDPDTEIFKVIGNIHDNPKLLKEDEND